MKQLSIFEEGIIVGAKKIVSTGISIKNLKKQYKELFAGYIENPSQSSAKQIVDILVNMDDLKEDLKSARKDINVNVEELTKKKTEEGDEQK